MRGAWVDHAYCLMTFPSSATNASTSSKVFWAEKLTRTAERARSRPTPMAMRVSFGLGFVEWQAAPDEMQKPLAESASTVTDEGMPGMEKLIVCGARRGLEGETSSGPLMTHFAGSWLVSRSRRRSRAFSLSLRCDAP